MIDVIKQQLNDDMPSNQKLNIVREFLQIQSLKILHEKKLFDKLAFVGGTALRILFDLRRFSEDLDFSLIDGKEYDCAKINSQLTKSLALYNLPVETKMKSDGAVNSIMLKFTGLLQKLGISEVKEQKLSIKIEIDTNPPAGWKITNTIVNKIYMFSVSHYDLPSMYASKLHACFFRKFIKGRDFYDFIWYTGKKIKPSFTLLNNSIMQTEGFDAGLNEQNFKQFLLKGIDKIDFGAAKKDVERFMENKDELSIFDKNAVKNTIESAY